MTVVVDASTVVHWLFELAGSSQSEQVLRSGGPIIAPDLIIAEAANAVWKTVAFNDVTPQVASLSLSQIQKYFDELVPSIDLKDRALEIAIELRHPAYDCFYLALAEKRECKLITADQRLIRVCAGTSFAGMVSSL